MTRYAAIRSTGLYVPDVEITNDALRSRFAKTAPEFVDKTEAVSGIRTRFHAQGDWATSDLAVRAADHALTRAGITAADVDLVIVGTDTPDYVTPSTSVIVQHKLGATRAGTFDVGCACASFPTALATAAGLIATNAWIKNALVIGAYMMHKLADPMDAMTFFYGDGAGAVVLQPSDSPGVLSSALRADGSYAKHWGIFAGGTAEPTTEESLRAGRTNVRMLEKYPAEVNDDGWPALVRTVAERNHFALSEIDLIIFTQVRRQTIEKAMSNLGLPMTRTHMVMHKWGYTGSACIPMALHDAGEQGRLHTGARVVLVGSGVGYNQSAVALHVH